MNSIRKKLFIYIGSLILCLVGLTILVNSVLLEPYYVNKQKDALLDSFNSIDQIDDSDYESSIKNLLLIENRQRIDILIRDADNNTIYATSNYFANSGLANQGGTNTSELKTNTGNNGQTTGPPSNHNVYKQELIDDNLRFSWVHDTSLNVRNLMLHGTLSNGNTVNLKVPLAAVENTIDIINNFTFIIGGIIFVIAVFFSFLISNHFTKPIIEMNNTTKNLKELKFGSKCEIKSNDEIGQLAQSINDMSDALSENINALHKKNAQLKIEIDKKNRLDEKRKELLNNVSHELKTPLSLMQGYAEGLKVNVSKDKEKSDFYCDVIMDEAARMNHLVEKLLNINQVEFGDTVLYKTKFEINEFAENILKKYDKIFNEKKIDCKFIKAKKTIISADVFMIESVFTNYINNAVNYVDDNKKIIISIAEDDKKVMVSVYNTSPPFSANDMEKIWNSFYKADKARTREKGGHGLGLSIVKAIQEAHGNKYGVENRDDGVYFWFEVDKG